MTSITPSQAYSNTPRTITIKGTGFGTVKENITVTIDSSCTVTSVSDEQIECTTPTVGFSGESAVTVRNLTTNRYDKLPTGFTFLAAPPTPAKPVFTDASPTGTGTTGTDYSYSFKASGEPTPMFSVTSGSLPDGLTLDAATGVLSGKPTKPGTYTFRVTATNTEGTAVTGDLTIVVSAPDNGGNNGGGGSNSGGTSSESTSTPTTTKPSTPPASPDQSVLSSADPLKPIRHEQNPRIPAAGLPAGDSVSLVDGSPVPVSVRPNAPSNASGVVAKGDGWAMRLQGRGGAKEPLGLTSGKVLVLESPRASSEGVGSAQPAALIRGTGFQPNSMVRFYLLPDTLMGSCTADAAGNVEGRVLVPSGVSAGVHTLQVNGLASTGTVRSLSLGVLVKQAQATSTTASVRTSAQFAPNSTDLTTQAKTALQRLVVHEGKNPATVTVVGFVQKSGTNANDRTLSTQRAQAVAAYLRALGVQGDFTVSGAGVGGPGAADRKVVVTVTRHALR